MEKITEKLLLEKSSPKTSKLEQIKSLNLSGLNLKLQDLPICLLSRLRSLERWDLSRNQLQELPQNLDLPALQFLDLSDNQLEDITSLESLQHLEELKMEDNLYITISDHYKLMVLLPRLMMLNSKNVSSTASHVRYVYTENLRARVSLKPLHVLQCHSKLDSCDDFSTQLWSCSFQPQEHSTGGLVATCGGDTLCLIDCDSGMVMKKYKVAGEEFFSLAWSTVLMSRGDQDSAQLCSILAAGGKRGLVKLIHPRENFAYGEFRASRKSLSVLRFHERQGNFLFTGAYDNRIVMWDVGGVDSHYNFKVNQLLVMQISSTPLHICLPAASSLLCGSDDGLFYFNTQPTSKNFQYNCIYLWSWGRTAAQRPDKKNRLVSAVVLAELQWTNTDVPYLSLSTCPDQAYIVCGDDEGRLWTYDMSNLQNILRDKPAKPLQPTKILEWPGPVRKGSGPMKGPSINTVAADPELRYVVALSDQNMVIVWKRAETDGSS
uniref:Leucine-rich repeat and WD repeat-containing protein 1 n=1 Tax=Takifugu rubripes TaxID=31033 RepID=A0A674MM19_TAKRU